jgi:hypothetical protein
MAFEGYATADVLDLVNATLPNFEKMKFSAPQKYTRYPILNKMLGKGIVRGGGKYAEKRVVIKESDRTQFTGLYGTKEYSRVDVLRIATAPWVYLTTDWMFDRREALINKDPFLIVDKMETDRLAALRGMANVFEENAWQTIVTEASETTSMRGIPYWISKGAGTSGGYNGTYTVDRSLTQITSPGGINPATTGQEYWANYTQSHSTNIDHIIASNFAVSLIDDISSFIVGLGLTYENINFQAPQSPDDIAKYTELGMYTIFMDTKTKIVYDVGVNRYNVGQNYGYDFQKFNGMSAFNGTPIQKAPQLDTLANDTITGKHPVYFVNFNEFELIALETDEFHEHTPMLLPNGGGNVAVINVDFGGQFMCGDRRSQGLLWNSV